MPHVLTPNTVKVCLRFLQNGQNTCQVYHVDVGQEPTVAILNTLGGLFKTWWNSYIRDFTHSGTSLQAVELYDVSSDDDDGVIYTTGLPLSGSAAAGPMPNNVSVATKLLTGLTGRSRRGRKFFAGLDAAYIAAGSQQITPALQTGLQTAFTQLITDLTEEAMVWVVNSIISNGVPRLVGLNTPIIGTLTNVVLDSMRRRLPERGN